MKPYLITYDLIAPGRNYGNLFAAIRSLGTHCKPLLSTWVVRSNLTAAQIRDKLQHHVDSNDKVLVTPISGQWNSYNLTAGDASSLSAIAA